MTSLFQHVMPPDCSEGTEGFQSLESYLKVFIGSKLLKFIGKSAQIEPIFAMLALDLSRYIHVAYKL